MHATYGPHPSDQAYVSDRETGNGPIPGKNALKRAQTGNFLQPGKNALK